MSTEKHEVHRDGIKIDEATFSELREAAEAGKILPGDMIRVDGSERATAAAGFAGLSDLFSVPPESAGGGPAPAARTRVAPGTKALFVLACGGGVVLAGLTGLWNLPERWFEDPGDVAILPIRCLLVVVLCVLLRTVAVRTRSLAIPILLGVGSIFLVQIVPSIVGMSGGSDDAIVRNGTYDDICPGRTVEALLRSEHDEIEWTCYLNKYGHRSVLANCIPVGQSEPSMRLVWTIDDQEGFWIHYAEKSGVPVDPYGLLLELCRRMPLDSAGDATP